MEKKNTPKEDTSMKTGYLVMAFGSIVGLLFKGLNGLILGAMFGFAVTVIVFLFQEAVEEINK